MYKIYKSFDCSPPTDMRGTFLDIFKAFNKVWHEGLIFKLKTYGVDGNLLKPLENYLTGHQRKIVLNDQTSPCQIFLAGIQQGSLLGPLLFLIYINDLPDGIPSCKIFADDTSLFSKVNDKSNCNTQMNSDLESKPYKYAFLTVARKKTIHH